MEFLAKTEPSRLEDDAREAIAASKSFKEDLSCCKEALSQKGFIYSVSQAKVKETTFPLQAVMEYVAPFIYNTVSKDNENNMQEKQVCEHVREELENGGDGGRLGEIIYLMLNF